MKKVKVIQPFYEKLNAELYVSEERFNELIAKGLVEELDDEEVTTEKYYADETLIETASLKDGKRKVLSQQDMENS